MLLAVVLRMLAFVVPIPSAALLVTAWAVSPPFTAVVGWLVTRQWVWGLAFALGSLAAFRRWQALRAAPALLLSAGLYLGAVLWKDVFLPLPAIAFLIAVGPVSRRAVDVIPLLGVAALYLAWRTAILGGLGGYGELELSIAAITGGIARSAPVTFAELFGSPWAWLAPLALAAPIESARLAIIWALVVAPLAILFPSSPVATLPLRYLFPVSLVAFVAVAVAASRWSASVSFGLVALASGVAVAHGLPRSIDVLADLRVAGEEGRDVVRFLERSDCDAVVLVGLDHTPQWFATAMDRIHEERLGRPFARAVLVGGLAAHASAALAVREHEPCGVFAYEPSSGTFRRSTGEIGEQARSWLASRTGAAPALETEVRSNAVDLRWSAVEDAARYLVFYGEEPDLYAAALPVTGLAYPARNLAPGDYCFRVAAERIDGGVGRLSEETCVSVHPEER